MSESVDAPGFRHKSRRRDASRFSTYQMVTGYQPGTVTYTLVTAEN